jgi:hypothetical protein
MQEKLRAAPRIEHRDDDDDDRAPYCNDDDEHDQDWD